MSDQPLFPESFTQFDIVVSENSHITLHGTSGGTGPPLLLLHGFPQTHAIWHKIAPVLSKSYTLIMPDLRGYGGSSKPPTPSLDPSDHSLYAKDAMAADMAHLMTSLGHDSFHVVGHDRGGRVAHKLAVDYPDRVKTLMLLDICPTLAMYKATDQLFATAYWHWFFLIQPAPFPEDAIAAAPEVFARKTLRGLPKVSGEGIFDERAYEEYTALFRDRACVHGMCEDYRAAAKEDIAQQREDLERGRRLRCPVRVLWGDAGLIEKKFDAIWEWGKVCEGGCMDSRSRCVSSGHYIPEEVPEDLTQDILEFCRSWRAV